MVGTLEKKKIKQKLQKIEFHTRNWLKIGRRELFGGLDWW